MIILDREHIDSVLVVAKRKTYAAGKESSPSPDGSEEIIWQDKNWFYRDKFWGSNPWIGTEALWRKENGVWKINSHPVWVMNYSGELFLPAPLSKDRIVGSLKKALLKVPSDLPYRGPQVMRDKETNLTYINRPNTEENSSFGGEESMLHDDDVQVEALNYRGFYFLSRDAA